MTKWQYFHFTLGPVQSFVGQARRTRDFWAGSFLLSWLSGVAMLSVEAQDGTILFPRADENFLEALRTGNKKKPLPEQGVIPNRFKAKVDENFKPEQVVEDVRKVWCKLAEHIYKEEVTKVLGVNSDSETRAIWDRQVEHFWDMNWVLTENIEDSSGLDRRKNWRSQFFPDEPGIKCSLMGDWQELSGVIGVSKKEREQREGFWKQFEKKWKSDFSVKEHLCAISYIKRRFLSCFASFSCQITGGEVHGWELPQAVPSVAYIAAAPWFAKVLSEDENSEEFKAFFDAGVELESSFPEYDTEIACVEKASTNKKHKGLDGNLFHKAALDNPNTFSDREKAATVKRALKKLTKKHGPVSPFYAVLIMDGDELGKQMSDGNKQELITRGLADFTKEVPKLVKERNGFLIYAGGDDVLALVTLEDALDCALAVRKHYEDCFRQEKAAGKLKTSISAAIIYTHINTPLKNVLHESHELLDTVAKEKAGRDAIAIRVYKGSGLAVEWAKKWDEALTKTFVLQEIQKEFQSSEDGRQFSSKFFYKIRQRLDVLYGNHGSNNPLSEKDIDGLATDLLAVDYLQSLDNRKLSMEQARKIIEPLMVQSKNAAADGRVTVDAALLVRFLAQKGIEGGRS